MTSRPRALVALLSACLMAATALVGCGSSGGEETTSTRDAKSPRQVASDDSAGSKHAAADRPPAVAWPYFGRLPHRTHHMPLRTADLDPPLKVAWQLNTHALIEFPPALAGGVAYLVNKYGNTFAVRLSDRKILWRRVVRKRQHGAPLDVTGPAYHRGRVYIAEIGGQLVSLDADDGEVVWRRNLGAHLESSPLVVGNTLYLGTDNAEVLALDIADGSRRWRFEAPGAVKASPSFERGRLFVGDYESGMFALDAKTGKPLWRTNTSRETGGRGGFYSSPAIAFGRVFAARDDGTVFAFDRGSGRVEWHFAAGGQIYGSPAVAKVPGTPPTVYIGAENGRLYALAVRDGKLRWSKDVGGPIPGTASVIGDTVFTSSFETRTSVGYNVHTHRRDFALDSAGYTPVISDGRRLYVAGYYTFFALEPKKPRR